MMAEISVPLLRTGRKSCGACGRRPPRRFTLAESVDYAMGMLAPPA
jgi:hypothetical protein